MVLINVELFHLYANFLINVGVFYLYGMVLINVEIFYTEKPRNLDFSKYSLIRNKYGITGFRTFFLINAYKTYHVFGVKKKRHPLSFL